MNCLEYRRAIGADPQLLNAELASHAGACPACAEYGAEMRLLNERIGAALRIPVPPGAAALPQGTSPGRARLPLAMAASFLLAAVVATILWLTLPRASLARDMVEHLEHEAAALEAREPVAESVLTEVLRKSDARVQGPLGRVTYAESCWFRGHFVPHLVVDEGSGPVTVLLLAHENVAEPLHFSEGGYTGVVAPAARGSIAVLTRDASQVEAIAMRLAKVLK